MHLEYGKSTSKHTSPVSAKTKSHTNQLIQPHADASAFDSALSKSAAYAQLLDSLTHLVSDTRFWPTNLANTASLLWHLYHSFPAPASSVNWAGFYVADADDSSKLLLGPFMGKVACQVIQVGKGVCGAAAAQNKTVLVDDVEEFPGHIACDGDSRSEIVVPIVSENGKVSCIDHLASEFLRSCIDFRASV